MYYNLFSFKNAWFSFPTTGTCCLGISIIGSSLCHSYYVGKSTTMIFFSLKNAVFLLPQGCVVWAYLWSVQRGCAGGGCIPGVSGAVHHRRSSTLPPARRDAWPRSALRVTQQALQRGGLPSAPGYCQPWHSPCRSLRFTYLLNSLSSVWSKRH